MIFEQFITRYLKENNFYHLRRSKLNLDILFEYSHVMPILHPSKIMEYKASIPFWIEQHFNLLCEILDKYNDIENVDFYIKREASNHSYISYILERIIDVYITLENYKDEEYIKKLQLKIMDLILKYEEIIISDFVNA